MEKEKHIFAFDVIRAICPFIILMYHYSCQFKYGPRPFSIYANGSWGYAIVTTFFVLSGAALYYGYPEIISVKKFYYKRAKSLFPKFYMVWAFSYFMKVIEEGSFLYKGESSFWKFLFTAIGLDGYLNGLIKGYYQVGEWFLGALVILYIIYPVILKLINKSSIIIISIVATIYLSFTLKGYIVDNVELNELLTGFIGIPSCCLSFVIGMVLCKHRKKILYNPIWGSLSLFVSLLIIGKKFNYAYKFGDDVIRIWLNISEHLLGVILFISLYCFLEMIDNKWGMSIQLGKKIWKYLAGLSYPIFLIHHKLIHKLYLIGGGSGEYAGVGLIISIIILSVIFAVVLNILQDRIKEKYIININITFTAIQNNMEK